MNTFAQTITEIEYFIDDDPGVGLAYQWPGFTQSSTVDFIRDLPEAAALPAGTYTLHIRAKDSNGVWGFTEARPFIVKENNSIIINPVADIDKIEYFIDDDPGFGLAYQWPGFTPNSSVDFIRDLPEVAALPAGSYTLHTRAKNTNGI